MVGDLANPQSDGQDSRVGGEFSAAQPGEVSGSWLSPLGGSSHLGQGSDDDPQSPRSAVAAGARRCDEMLFATLGSLEIARQRLRKERDLGVVMPGVKSSLREAFCATSRLLADVLGTYATSPVWDLNRAIGEGELEGWTGSAAVLRRPHPATLEVRIQPDWLRWVLRYLVESSRRRLGSKCVEVRVSLGLHSPQGVCADVPLGSDGASLGSQAWIQVTVAADGARPEVDDSVLGETLALEPTDFEGQVALGVASFCRGSIRSGGTVERAFGARLLLPLVSSRVMAGRELPALPTERPAPQSSVETSSQIMPRAPRAIPMRGVVLVVDDEPLILKTCTDMLRRCGVRTLTASDGVEALSVFGAHHDEIECILLDMSMPRMDGLSTLDGLRRIRGDVKVVLCSGHCEDAVIDELGGRDPVGFLQKPYRLEHLRQALIAMLADPSERPSMG